MSSELLAGGVAGCCEALLTMPLEVTKNRIQMGHGPPSPLLNLSDTIRRAGPRGLYVGLQPQLLQVAFKGAIRFTAVDKFNALLPPGCSFLSGLLAGCVEGLVWVVPTERLKLLRQAEIGGGAARAGLGGSLRLAVGEVIAKQGLAGLWVGSGATVARQAVANGMRFFLYDHIKASMPQWVPAPAPVAGGITGVASVVISNPIDVLKTTYQSAPVDQKCTRGALAVASDLVKRDGWGVFLKGMQVRALKIGVGQAVMFGVYDAVRTRLRRSG